DLVLCDGTGRPEHPDRFSRQFQRYVKATDLPPLRGPHNLRHTWATLALRAGVHPKVVSDRLGHATIAVTIDTYSHVAPSLDAEAADTVAADIFGSSA
ncbi:MAG TPA: tyrosine-type recombinase/integrase, partial [Microthrixaceae bacterium]|nr:tyrosine-type recombinase/integrase [Microthrixaceae bacterium]